MREIVFKGKRLDNGEWIIGNLVVTEDAEEGWEAIIIPTFDSNMFTKGGAKGDLGFENWHRVEENTICQYTGLTDKNGNKIWENDIVKRYNANGDEWRISKIVWADHSLNMGWCIEDVKSLTEYSNRLFKIGFDVNDTEKCEVIGNIFDNLELLEGGAE